MCMIYKMDSKEEALSSNPNKKSINVWSDTLQRHHFEYKDPEY